MFSQARQPGFLGLSCILITCLQGDLMAQELGSELESLKQLASSWP